MATLSARFPELPLYFEEYSKPPETRLQLVPRTRKHSHSEPARQGKSLILALGSLLDPHSSSHLLPYSREKLRSLAELRVRKFPLAGNTYTDLSSRFAEVPL